MAYVFEVAVNNTTITMSFTGTDDVFCDIEPSASSNASALLCETSQDITTVFYKYWDMQNTAPFALGKVVK